MKISLAQINICFANTETNFTKAVSFIRKAAESKSDLILFPELWTSGYDLNHSEKYNQENQLIIDALQQLSSKYHIGIGGSFINKSEGIYRNSFIVIDQFGNIMPIYHKIHLFSLMDEKQFFSPGNHLQVIDLMEYITGLSICYDLRFPELYTAYFQKNCQLILITAEWPLSRIAHWKALLVARAIENQAFIAATNAVGQTGEEIYGGTSMLVSPWGEIVCCGNEHEEELQFGNIDYSEVARARERIPISSDRRHGLF